MTPTEFAIGFVLFVFMILIISGLIFIWPWTKHGGPLTPCPPDYLTAKPSPRFTENDIPSVYEKGSRRLKETCTDAGEAWHLEARARKARMEKFRQRRLEALSQAGDELERWEA